MTLTWYRSDRSLCGRKIGFARSARCFVEMCITLCMPQCILRHYTTVPYQQRELHSFPLLFGCPAVWLKVEAAVTCNRAHNDCSVVYCVTV